MGFFKRLASLFSGRPSTGGNFLTVYVLSHRCREPLSGQVNLLNELSQSEEDEGVYYTRKVMHGSGQNRCFASVEVELWFDGSKKLVRHEVQGGRWLTPEEYEVEVERFNAPPEEEEQSPASEEDGPPGSLGGG